MLPRDIGMAPCLMMMSQKDRILHVFLLIILWGQTATASPSTQSPIAGCVSQDGSSNLYSTCLKKQVLACIRGFYQADNCSADSCKACPPGTFTPDFNNCSVCFKCRPPCPPGYRETEPCTHLSDRKCELIPVSSTPTPMHDFTMEKSPSSVTKDVDGTTTEANIMDHGTTKKLEQVISSSTEESPSPTPTSQAQADDVPPNTSSTPTPKLPPAARDRHRRLDDWRNNQAPCDHRHQVQVRGCEQCGHPRENGHAQRNGNAYQMIETAL